MPIPTEVVLFGRVYAVRDVSPFHVSEGILGQAVYRDGVIYLDRKMDMALSLTTLWHEAVHMAQQEILGTVDEAQARWLSLFVHDFLVRNPALLECYREGPGYEPFEDDGK
jgi:hypothetical protein